MMAGADGYVTFPSTAESVSERQMIRLTGQTQCFSFVLMIASLATPYLVFLQISPMIVVMSVVPT